MTDNAPQIWRVHMGNQTLNREPVPGSWERLGGRGLLARILLDEVDARCDPLGPENKLIFAPGLLVGHMLSSTDRISVGGKSPLTGGIKESNAGGRTGLQSLQEESARSRRPNRNRKGLCIAAGKGSAVY